MNHFCERAVNGLFRFPQKSLIRCEIPDNLSKCYKNISASARCFVGNVLWNFQGGRKLCAVSHSTPTVFIKTLIGDQLQIMTKVIFTSRNLENLKIVWFNVPCTSDWLCFATSKPLLQDHKLDRFSDVKSCRNETHWTWLTYSALSFLRFQELLGWNISDNSFTSGSVRPRDSPWKDISFEFIWGEWSIVGPYCKYFSYIRNTYFF